MVLIKYLKITKKNLILLNKGLLKRKTIKLIYIGEIQIKKTIKTIAVAIICMTLLSCSVVHEEEIEMELNGGDDLFEIKEYLNKTSVEINIDSIDFNVYSLKILPINEHSDIGYIGMDVGITNFKEHDITYPVQNTRIVVEGKIYKLGLDGVREVLAEDDVIEYEQYDHTSRGGIELSEGERGRFFIFWEITDIQYEMQNIMEIDELSVRLVGLKGKDGVRLNYKLGKGGKKDEQNGGYE